MGKGGRACKKNWDGKASIYNLWTLKYRTRRKSKRRKKRERKPEKISHNNAHVYDYSDRKNEKRKTIASTRKPSY